MTISSLFQRLRRPPIAAALAITIAATTAAGAVQAQTTDASATQNTVAEKAVLTDLISGIVSAIKGAAPTANALIGSPSASALTVSPSVIGPSHKVLVLYDEPQGKEFQKLGKAYAIMLRNLIGHWNPTVDVVPVEQYTAGKMEQYHASMYVGSYYRGAAADLLLPASLLADVSKTKKTFVWFKNNLDQLRRVQGLTLPAKFGFEFDFMRGVAGDPAAAVPDFFDNVVYKGRELKKYYAYSGGQVFADPDIGYTRVTDSTKASVVVPIRNSAYAATGQTVEAPYIVRSSNFWYVADVPFSYIGPRDRYLVMADILHDMLGQSPDQGKKALVRFEDVGALVDPVNMKTLTDYLWPATGRRIPYSIATIPHHKDPLGKYNGGVALDLPLAQATDLKTSLNYSKTRGGSFVMHGYTHQYSNVPNLYTAVSGDDFEFWDATNAKLLPGDSQATWAARLTAGRAEMIAAGYTPFAFETPHYQGSPLAYKATAAVFGTVYERAVYYTSDSPNLQATGAARDFAVGQFFPYVIKKDYYGRKVLPENLGNIEYDITESDPTSYFNYTWQDLQLNAQITNAVVRNGVASFFFHPFWLENLLRPDGTSYGIDGFGDFKKLIDAITALGYTWTDPRTL
jgi:uncharacterized protein YdaL